MAELLNADLELIQDLKQKHGVIYLLEVPVVDELTGEEEIEKLYLKKLDRKTYSAGSKISQKNETQGVEFFLRSLTVHGDVEKIISNFDALRSATELIVEVISVKTGNVTRL